MKSVDETKQQKRSDVWEHFIEYAPKIVVVAMTGFFTWHAAWYLTQNAIMSGFTVALSEGFWFLWQFLRDEHAENGEQTKDAKWGWWISTVFIAITDLASGIFLASDAGFSLFATIPAWAQVVPTVGIPVMAIVQGVLLAIYTGDSDSRKEQMEVRRQLRQARNDEKKAVAEAKRDIAIHQAKNMRQRATTEAPIIGKQKADAEWDTLHGSVTYASDVEAVNPTKPKRRK